MGDDRQKEFKSVDELLKIGRHKYAALKGRENLSEEEKEQIKLYEEKHNIGVVYKPFPKKNIEWVDGVPPSKEVLYKLFIKTYPIVCGKEFIKTKNSIKNLEPIIKYFAQDETFSESELVLNNFGGKPLNNNLKKGLLLVGSPGNGKSSIMEVMAKMINHYYIEAKTEHWRTVKQWEQIRFLFRSCTNVVMEYEGLEGTNEKEHFFKQYSGYRYCFDDLNREEKASNYGVKELFKDILFERNAKGAKTHLTMNYPDATGYQTIEHALRLIGVRYGAHIYDRIFEDFNIVEFKGSSFRK